MPHSLRARLSGLRYKKIISDKDYNRLCKALDNENVLDKIRSEIEQTAKDYDEFDDYRRVYGLWIAVDIIDKYKAETEQVGNTDRLEGE